MCLRYEKIICYDWIIQRLLELFVYTDFIFIVILNSSFLWNTDTDKSVSALIYL